MPNEQDKETIEEALALAFAVFVKEHETEEMPSIASTVLEFVTESPLLSGLDGIEFKQMVLLIWTNIDKVYNHVEDSMFSDEVQEMLNLWFWKVAEYIDFIFEENEVRKTVDALITKERWGVEFRILLQYIASYMASQMHEGSLLYTKYFCNILAYMGYYLSNKMQ